MAQTGQSKELMQQVSSPRVSAIDADWSREQKRFFEWNPSRSLIAAIRRYQRHERGSAIDTLIRMISVIQHRFWSAVTGADIPVNSQIGGGLLLPHPNGIVVHPAARIGVNCLLFQQVTLAGAVTVGGHVDIGAGAKILGPLTIGDDAVIGANAVVTHDVAPSSTMVGIPARPLQAEN